VILIEFSLTIYYFLQAFNEEKLSILQLVFNMLISFLLPLIFGITIKKWQWGVYVC